MMKRTLRDYCPIWALPVSPAALAIQITLRSRSRRRPVKRNVAQCLLSTRRTSIIQRAAPPISASCLSFRHPSPDRASAATAAIPPI